MKDVQLIKQNRYFNGSLGFWLPVIFSLFASGILYWNKALVWMTSNQRLDGQTQVFSNVGASLMMVVASLPFALLALIFWLIALFSRKVTLTEKALATLFLGLIFLAYLHLAQ